jgi:TRAP-type transport system periplasmic protein
MMRALLVACALLPSLAYGDATVLRLATVAPDGTAWAREFRTFARDVERRTDGRVRIRWFWGSIAGGDSEVAERIRRGQLEGAGSGGPLCATMMPSLRVLQIPGMFQNAAEVKDVLNRLSGSMAEEAAQAGFTNIGISPIGASVYIGRHPVTTFAELRHEKLWGWDAETTLMPVLREMGLDVVEAPVDRAAREFDLGHIDGFWAIPAAALAFQWSARAHNLVNLRGDYIVGCVLVANRAFLALSADDQRELKAAGAQLRDRFDEVSRREEEALLGGLFQKQGVSVSEPSEKLRAEFFEMANAARDRVGARLITPELLQRVRGMLSDFRAEHWEHAR